MIVIIRKCCVRWISSFVTVFTSVLENWHFGCHRRKDFLTCPWLSHLNGSRERLFFWHCYHFWSSEAAELAEEPVSHGVETEGRPQPFNKNSQLINQLSNDSLQSTSNPVIWERISHPTNEDTTNWLRTINCLKLYIFLFFVELKFKVETKENDC